MISWPWSPTHVTAVFHHSWILSLTSSRVTGSRSMTASNPPSSHAEERPRNSGMMLLRITSLMTPNTRSAAGPSFASRVWTMSVIDDRQVPVSFAACFIVSPSLIAAWKSW